MLLSPFDDDDRWWLLLAISVTSSVDPDSNVILWMCIHVPSNGVDFFYEKRLKNFLLGTHEMVLYPE
jgi:hypothetical protein